MDDAELRAPEKLIHWPHELPMTDTAHPYFWTYKQLLEDGYSHPEAVRLIVMAMEGEKKMYDWEK